MRLICPNCGAQYEVAADVIPEDGRDVQCSNCGQTWFETPQAPSAAAEDDGFAETPPLDDAPAPDVTADRADPPVNVTAADEAEDVDAPEPEADIAPPAPARRPLDPSIADILREEAAREAEARKAEAASLEEQPDLGLTDPPPAAAARRVDPVREGRARVDRLQGRPAAPQPTGTGTAIGTGSRKDLFPDIEEINSTLRHSADRESLPLASSDEARASRRSGRTGFLTTLAVIVALGLIYAFAAQIADAVPPLAEPLAGYVAAVDSGRLWLDQQVQSLLGDPIGG